MHSFFVFVSLYAVFAFGSCGLHESVDKTDDIFLRIENISETDFSSVKISYPESGVVYSDVVSGQTSDYKKVVNAYRYGRVEVVAGNDVYLLQPFDYLEEEILGPGRYTYILNIAEGNLRLEFRQD